MLERDLLPPDAPSVDESVPTVVDTRGWLVAMVALVVIGLVTLRSAPAPDIPERIANTQGEAWMVDALPGIGSRTRERHLQSVRDGRRAALPSRSQEVASQVFIWPTPTHTSPPSVR